MDVDIDLAKTALESKICEKTSLGIEDAAAGIISVVNSNMVRAVRIVSVERGYDAREFTLMAFGGAGPLHACEVSEELGIKQVLIPPSPGTLCSLGLLMADTRFDLSRSNIMIACQSNMAAVDSIFKNLASEGDRLLTNEGIVNNNKSYKYIIDCRYERQNYEISIEIPALEFNMEVLEGLIDSFHREHKRAYGYYDCRKKVQMVNYRVSAIGSITKPDLVEYPLSEDIALPSPAECRMVRYEGCNEFIETKVYQRKDIPIGAVIAGPAIIEQMESTSVIPPKWTAFHDKFANLIVKYQEVE